MNCFLIAIQHNQPTSVIIKKRYNINFDNMIFISQMAKGYLTIDDTALNTLNTLVRIFQFAFQEREYSSKDGRLLMIRHIFPCQSRYVTTRYINLLN